MAEKATVVADYDGPFLNERPLLSSETVSDWFSAEGCNAATNSTEAIVRLLIEYEFVGLYWKGGIECRFDAFLLHSLHRKCQLDEGIA